MDDPIPAIPDITEKTVVSALNAIKQIIEIREGLRGSDKIRNRVMTLNKMLGSDIIVNTMKALNGWSGYFDDGANFRITVENGIIISVSASVAGGYAVS